MGRAALGPGGCPETCCISSSPRCNVSALNDTNSYHFSNLLNLENLELGGTCIGDHTVINIISGMKKLERLNLARTHITDISVPIFINLPCLKILSLDWINLSDASIDVLIKSNISTISIESSLISYFKQ
ncbi:leucine-rich repeat-containing protein [Tetraselmis virus 1]|uniref:Leucine-rich repeat-containing protein n=1 Tax=Tetraselmis virus 1 TaxID=2060617 RepID=A0A2P0VNN4_9VIRU|nr:leucine-rich repeat-containing protein [Tetraselmis virus 1]AUF82526.1 leucine-rich repeat-containing protein [Tetraselmis virus 1]